MSANDSLDMTMQSLIHPDITMRQREIEPRLTVYECPKSGGLWVPPQARPNLL